MTSSGLIGHNAIITTVASSEFVFVVNATNAAIPNAWPASLKQAGAYINGAWGGLQPYGNGQTMWNIAPYSNHEDLYAVQDNISKVRGNHLFKAGAYYSTNTKDQSIMEAQIGQPLVVVASPLTPTTNSMNIFLPGLNTALDPTGVGQLFHTSENSVNGLAQVKWHDFEWYLGDTWKISHNVTLSYGFRWSFYREPYGNDNHWSSFSLADYNPAGYLGRR